MHKLRVCDIDTGPYIAEHISSDKCSHSVKPPRCLNTFKLKTQILLAQC